MIAACLLLSTGEILQAMGPDTRSLAQLESIAPSVLMRLSTTAFVQPLVNSFYQASHHVPKISPVLWVWNVRH